MNTKPKSLDERGLTMIMWTGILTELEENLELFRKGKEKFRVWLENNPEYKKELENPGYEYLNKCAGYSQ